MIWPMDEKGARHAVVGVGRNVALQQMETLDWALFRSEVRACFTDVAADVHGITVESSWGREQSYWVAGDISSPEAVRRRLKELARRYSQEAIALTLGVTQLVVPVTARLP